MIQLRKAVMRTMHGEVEVKEHEQARDRVRGQNCPSAEHRIASRIAEVLSQPPYAATAAGYSALANSRRSQNGQP